MGSEKTGEALLALYDAAYLEGDWVRALDALGAATQARGVMVFATNQSDQFTFDVGFSNSLYADKAEVLEEYGRRFLADRNTSWDAEGVEILLQKPAFHAVLDTDLWSLDYLRAVPEVRYIREHVGVFRRVAFNLSESPDLQSGLILQYGTEIAEPPVADRQLMARLAPHVGKAIATTRFFSPLRQRYRAVLAVLDRLDLAICLLDGQGRLVLENRAAADLLARGDGIARSAAGTLRCQSEEEDRALAAACRTIAETATGRGARTEMSVTIPRRGHADPLLCIVSPLRDAQGEIDPALSGCMVTFVDTARIILTDMAAFARAYGLTGAETEVAALMRDGLPAPEIAEQRGVAPETVKTQIKAILAKTGTRNRVQFVWKLVGFAPPVMGDRKLP